MTLPTVLVIEDNALNRKLVRVLLSQEPLNLLFAETAEEGLERAGRDNPDLILMDVRLPGIDGLTATRRIRADEHLRDTTVVAFTAHAMRGDREKAFAAGCDGYITKPIDTRNFAEQVHRFLTSPARNEGMKRQWNSEVRILLIEEQPAALKSMEESLDTGWAQCRSTVAGATAIDLARTTHPDVVIIDVSGFEGPGAEMYRELRRETDLKDMCILVTSCVEHEQARKEILELGVDTVLCRPLDYPELRRKLRLELEAWQEREQLALRRKALSLCGVDHDVPSPKGTVLIVDDDPNSARILEYSVRGLGCHTKTATSGAEALAVVSEGAVDLVLLDVLLPDLNGLEVLRKMQEDPNAAHIPVMMVTNLTDHQTRARAFAAGADELLTKPVNDVALGRGARRLLARKQNRDELARLAREFSGQPPDQAQPRAQIGEALFIRLLETQAGHLQSSRHPLAHIRISAQGKARPPVTWERGLRRYTRAIDWVSWMDNGDLAVMMPYVGIEAEAIMGAFLESSDDARMTESGRLVVPKLGLAVFPDHGYRTEQLMDQAGRLDWKGTDG